VSTKIDWTELLRKLEDDLAHTGEAVRFVPWDLLAGRIRELSEILVLQYGASSALEAEDVAQDVLLKLHDLQAIRSLRAKDSPEGYLVVLIRNRIFDELRREQLRRGGELPDDYPAPGDSPLSAEEAISLERVLDELSDDDWGLLRMRFWEGRSIGEIARELDVRYSTASVRLFRLLRKLRDRLES
jgi:RNA polymerase sigma factor (sigma-70 family)